MRVKILKTKGNFLQGTIIDVSKNEAFGLIDSGYAEVTKDMTPDDYKQAGDKDGKPTFARSNRSGKR